MKYVELKVKIRVADQTCTDEELENHLIDEFSNTPDWSTEGNAFSGQIDSVTLIK